MRYILTVLTYNPVYTYEPGQCETASDYETHNASVIPPDALDHIGTALALNETVTLSLKP